MRQVLFVAAFDSQLKWCAQIRRDFEARGFVSRVVVPDIRSALSAAQIRDAGFVAVERITWEELLDAALEADVVVCGLAGPLTRALTIELSQRAVPGKVTPVLITGWVGVIIEKITAGYLDRCGSDIVAVNAKPDLAHFQQVAGRIELPTGNLLLTGLPFVSRQPQPTVDRPIRRVLFADQPTVPANRAERLFVYRRLIEYAIGHPDREVLLKPRHRRDEDTFHTMKHHPEDLLADVELPANLRIDYTPISEILDEVDLLITMSSTACLEAVDRGCRVALILDLGIHERYGNHVFLDSGLLRTFEQLGRDAIGSPDPQWLAGYFFAAGRSATELLVDRAEELLATGSRPSQQVWASEYFRSAVDFHSALKDAGASPRGRGLLRRRMERHGRARGVAVHAAAALVPPVLASPLRRAVRRMSLFGDSSA